MFFQDDWRIGRHLILNLGLRYEIDGPIKERFNRINRDFDFLTVNPIEETARANYPLNPIPEIPAADFHTPGGLLFANVGGMPRGLFNTAYNHWSPRVGLAYSITPKIVFRAGYGIFYESLGVDLINVFQQGFSQRTTAVASLDNGLTYQASLANPIPGRLLQPAGASAGLKTYLGQAPSLKSKIGCVYLFVRGNFRCPTCGIISGWMSYSRQSPRRPAPPAPPSNASDLPGAMPSSGSGSEPTPIQRSDALRLGICTASLRRMRFS